MSDANALALVREAGGRELAERLLHLDSVRANGVRPADARIAAPDLPHSLDADVIVAGGGLSLLIAAAMAKKGLRVIVLDRARVGAAHREWNASGAELHALVASGILSARELDDLVVARYARGICTFRGSPATIVTGVLDHAIAAGPLLDRARAIAIAHGAKILDGHPVVGVGESEHAVSARVRDAGGDETELTGRLLLDARGSASPYARGDIVCPTVGGVLRGLAQGDAPDEIDPSTGEILVTNEPCDEGRQHLWEAFPGRDGETTVYSFYYARTGHEGTLTSLFARFFATLKQYKRGDATMLRPTFGFIPAWSRLRPAPRPPAKRILLVGDAAARHSPLTMCGFGSMLRSFAPAADAVVEAVARGGLPRCDDGVLADDAPIHALTGGLALVMASPPRDPNALNGLLGAAFASLAARGNDAYGALLRDEMTPAEFTRFLREVGARRPSVYAEVLQSIPVHVLSRWGWRVARGFVSARRA